jgi:hypothetical protein
MNDGTAPVVTRSGSSKSTEASSEQPDLSPPDPGVLEEGYGSIVVATAFSSLLIIATKVISALFAAGDRGVAVTTSFWRGVVPTVSVIGFPSDFAHVVTWSTVGTGVVACTWCLVGTVVRRVRPDARWTFGALLAVPMATLLVAFEWFRFGWGADVLEPQTILRLLSLLGLSAVAYVVFGLRYATKAAHGVPLSQLIFPPPLPQQESRRYN